MISISRTQQQNVMILMNVRMMMMFRIQTKESMEGLEGMPIRFRDCSNVNYVSKAMEVKTV